jgi:hypothetical protein
MSILKDAVAKNNFQTCKSAIPLYVHLPLSDAPVKLYNELIANVSILAENVTALYNADSVSPPVSPPHSSERNVGCREKVNLIVQKPCDASRWYEVMPHPAHSES